MGSKLKFLLNNKWFSTAIICLAAIIIFSQADHRFGYTSTKEKENNCIASDGNGYYIYLPQYIVYPDSNKFSFINHLSIKYPNSKFFEMIGRKEDTGDYFSKFYTGTAVLQSPFYYSAHLVQLWNSWEPDGYSLGYRFSIQLAAIFYWLIGIVALFRLFARLGFQRFHILLAIVIVTFGTNLNYYTSFYVSMSHTYSFAMVACFLNVAQLWATKQRASHFLWMLLLISVIGIIRPVNVLVILIVPFLFDSFSQFWSRFLELFTSKKLLTLIGITLFCVPIAIQLFIQLDQTGTMSLYTYSKEGFTNALSPQFWSVLFSYHKGFFVYAPVMFIMFIGVYFFIRHAHRYFLIGWFVCVVIWLYAICSWWCWDYGGGLGMRALIELLPLFVFPILYLFKFANRYILMLSSMLIVVGIYFYQLFQVQFNTEIIHCCTMEKESFWSVFMKTDKRFQWKVDFDSKREYLPNENFRPDFKVKFVNGDWHISDKLINIKSFSSDYEDNPTLIYSISKGEQKNYAKIEGQILLNDSNCNPFFTVKYFNDSVMIDESFFTIGSGINDAFSFESFRLEVNHIIPNECARVEVNLHNGGCAPKLKHLTYTKLSK